MGGVVAWARALELCVNPGQPLPKSVWESGRECVVPSVLHVHAWGLCLWGSLW